MANDLYFSRDTRVIMEIGDSSWEIPLLDGFSFSQSTNTSEVTLNEFENSSEISRRGRRMFNDSFAPAEWSFSTYARPFKSGGSPGDGTKGKWDYSASTSMHAVEEALWAAMVAKNITLGTVGDIAGDDNSAWSDTTAMSNNATRLQVSFANSNKAALTEFNLYFILGSGAVSSSSDHTVYKLSNCAVNEASIDFDIEGITTIAWSGFGKQLEEVAVTTIEGGTTGEVLHADKLINEGTGGAVVKNFIRNRLTALTIAEVGGTTYPITITGGNITFSNNITYLTPETLGKVNLPLAHVAGTRNISGSLTCYLNSSSNSSADLFETLLERTTGTSAITNEFDLKIEIGGSAAPNLTIDLDHCHLELPTHSIEDIISTEITFHALPDSIGGADEATLQYKGLPL